MGTPSVDLPRCFAKFPNFKHLQIKEFIVALTNSSDYENDVLFSNDTGILGKRNSERSHQKSNLRPSDY